MTKQEIYDRVREHFTREGAQLAVTGGEIRNACVYRLDGDPHSPVRCAFGVLIPDELYRPEMEGDAVGGVLTRFPALKEVLGCPDSHTTTFLAQLQAFHDDVALSANAGGEAAHFVARLDKLASYEGLEVRA